MKEGRIRLEVDKDFYSSLSKKYFTESSLASTKNRCSEAAAVVTLISGMVFPVWLLRVNQIDEKCDGQAGPLTP